MKRPSENSPKKFGWIFRFASTVRLEVGHLESLRACSFGNLHHYSLPTVTDSLTVGLTLIRSKQLNFVMNMNEFNITSSQL